MSLSVAQHAAIRESHRPVAAHRITRTIFAPDQTAKRRSRYDCFLVMFTVVSNRLKR